LTTNISSLPQISATIIIATNADWRDTIQFQWPTGATNAGQPIDLTGISFAFQLRSSVDNSGILLNLSTSTGTLVVDAAQGTLTFAVPHKIPVSGTTDHMCNLPPGLAVADLIATAEGIVINLCQVGGPLQVTINRGVTRDLTLLSSA
jgi:hypothetical protein